MIRIENIKEKINPVLEKHKISRASLFGSMARGDAGEKSDVDIMIEFSGDHGGLFAMARLKRDLEKILKKKVDLMTYRSVNRRLKSYINKDKILIYSKRQ